MTEFASFLIEQKENIKEKKNVVLLQSLDFNEPETPLVLFDNVKRECDDAMRIFLRLRPSGDEEQHVFYETPNDYDVIAIPPPESASYRNFIHGYGKTSQKFTFSKLFRGDTSQDIVFEETTKPLLNKFVKGSDRLLFTYGTTSSGKTYTMNGQKRNVGIIPSSLISLYNDVQLSNDPNIMPVDFSEVSNLSSTEVQRILREKASLLKLSEKESSDVLHFLKDKQQCGEAESFSLDPDFKTTFWITFTEIYNECIYDLLDVTQSNNNKQMKRTMLDIRTARNGGSYVKGLSCYPAFSAEEAYRLLLVGRRSQKMGATRLNQNSSRSHTIFTIRAVRTTTSSRYLTRVSNFSFCDLAGSERTTKAQTSGVSQKEANNINTSLLALGRCIEILRRNQTNPCNMNLVPFRDSKLTRLFQTYLTGNGTASMIVCVNPDRQLFDESIQVLKFSALAREVVLQEKEKVDLPNVLRKSHFSRLGLNTPAKKSNRLSWGSDNDVNESEDIDQTLLEEEEYDEEFDEERLIQMIEELKRELLATKQEKRASEARLREQLNEEWSRTIVKMENDHSEQMQALREKMNAQILKVAQDGRNMAYAERKRRKRQVDSSNDDEESTKKQLATKEKQVIHLEAQLKDAEEMSAEYRETADILQQKLEQRRIENKQLEFQLSRLQDEFKKRKSIVKVDASFQTYSERNNSQDLSDCSIVTIEADTSLRSNCSTGSRYNRFSSFSTDKSIRVIKNTEAPGPPPSYFSPIQSSAALSTIPEPVTVKKKDYIFEISEEDLEEETVDNRSFLQHEADLRVFELEAKIESVVRDNERYAVALKEQKAKVSHLEKVQEEYNSKLVSREKTVMVLNDKERYNDIIVESIARSLGVLPSEGGVDVHGKLELILTAVKKVCSKSEGAKMAPLREVGEENGDSDDLENVAPARVTRSHNLDGRKRRTKKKK